MAAIAVSPAAATSSSSFPRGVNGANSSLPALLIRHLWSDDGSEAQQRYKLNGKLLQCQCSNLLHNFLKRWNSVHPDLAFPLEDAELARTPLGPGGAIALVSTIADELGNRASGDCQLFVRRRSALISAAVDDAADVSPSAPVKPAKTAVAVASKPQARPTKGRGLDYSKFDHIEDSDDEALVPSNQVVLPMAMPREAVEFKEYHSVWPTLLGAKDLPYTPAPDVQQMWGYYKHGGLDEQALLDQACEIIAGLPMRLPEHEWKAKTYTLLKKLDLENREDEARMWSIIHMRRFPRDADAYYNQGVLLNKLCDRAKFSGAAKTRLPDSEGSSKPVPTEQYCGIFSKAAQAHYKRCVKLKPKHHAGHINLIGCLERNEPTGWYEQVHDIARQAVRNGLWYNMWQRPPHFVPSLPATPWHDPNNFPLCVALRKNFAIIRAEYEEYIQLLSNRRDWDDSNTTPGLSDVGGREGALHDGGLAKSGRWREVPLFTNSALQQEYASRFPKTVAILQEHCADAVGLAFCAAGDIIFSVLTPGTRLRPHCGPSNARLTCHLGIKVPRTKDQGLWLRVANEAPRGWTEGECLVFDDSFEHEVVFENVKAHEPFCEERVVLLANFWHPAFQFKNHPRWRERSDPNLGTVDVESLPQSAIAKT